MAPDFPPRDPGLPRFVWALLGLVLAMCVALFVRPPRPLALPGTQRDAPVEGQAEVDPALLGQALFRDQGCADCHADEAGRAARGPGLQGLWARAGLRIEAPDYRGGARDPETYLREAVLDHCLDPLPGYDCPPLDDLAVRLSVGEVDSLLAYLARAGGGDEATGATEVAP